MNKTKIVYLLFLVISVTGCALFNKGTLKLEHVPNEAALKYAAEQVSLDEYQIKEYPEYKIDIDRLLRSYGLSQTAEDIAKETVGEELYSILEEAKAQTQRKGVQLLFPYSTKIQ